MNNPFTFDKRTFQRIICTALATLLVVAGLPILQSKQAAAAQLAVRSIQLTDSANSGTSVTSGVGSGTNVTYRVSFTTGAATADSLVIDFCSEDPIVNDTCTTPTGMTAASAAIGTVSGGGTVTSAGWSITPAAGRVKLAKNSGSSIAATTAEQFDLTGITNATTVGTFYARIYTYSNTTWGTYSSATSTGNFVDYGGIALSTTSVIQITARVQEQLTFCVSDAAQSTWLDTAGGGTGANANGCTATEVGLSPPAVTLGHGSPTPTLDSNTVDTASIYSQLSTNATYGAVIDLRNSNTSCGGLSADNNATCGIPPVNSGSATGALIAAGTAAFGMFVHDSTLGPSGVGSLTPSATYHTSGHAQLDTAHSGDPDTRYGMDSTTTLTNGGTPATNVGNVSSATNPSFGSIVQSTTAPTYRVNSKYTFAATAALTTPAGIYTANLNMIATGTF